MTTKGIAIIKQGGGSPEAIRALEEEAKIQLPEDYKLFLEKYNGGRTPETVFFYPAYGGMGADGDYPQVFFGVGDVENTAEKEQQFRDFLEHGLLPVARTDWGNAVLMDVRKNPGRMFFWDHELAWEEETDGDAHGEKEDGAAGPQPRLVPLADSFTEFTEMCGSDEKTARLWPYVQNRLAMGATLEWVELSEDGKSQPQKRFGGLFTKRNNQPLRTHIDTGTMRSVFFADRDKVTSQLRKNGVDYTGYSFHHDYEQGRVLLVGKDAHAAFSHDSPNNEKKRLDRN